VLGVRWTSSPRTIPARSATSAVRSRARHETGLPIDDYRRIVQTVQKGEREARQAKKEMVEATCVWSSPSPRNTPTAACSSST